MKISWRARERLNRTFVDGFVGTKRCFEFSFFPLLVKQGYPNPYALVCLLPSMHRSKRHFGTVEEAQVEADRLLAEWLEGFIQGE